MKLETLLIFFFKLLILSHYAFNLLSSDLLLWIFTKQYSRKKKTASQEPMYSVNSFQPDFHITYDIPLITVNAYL